MSDKDKLYLLRQALHMCFLWSVINDLSIRILNELILFIKSLTFNVWSAPSANISRLRQPQAVQTFFSSLAGLKNVHFVVCLPKNKFVRDDKLLYTK